MSDILLSAHDLSVRFGGVLAVNQVSFEVREGEVFTLIGPNGAGKTTVFNLISRLYTPTSGHLTYRGQALNHMPAHAVAAAGIARTFQNIELFEHASVLHNLLIGRHVHRHTGFWQQMLFLPSVRAEEMATRRKVEEVIDFLDLQHYRDTMVAGLPYGIRKVVELARALCTEPKLLLLDEPFEGVAPALSMRLSEVLAQLKGSDLSVLISQSDLNHASGLLDAKVVIERGANAATH